MIYSRHRNITSFDFFDLLLLKELISLLFHVKHLSTGYFTPGIRNYLTDFPENKPVYVPSPQLFHVKHFLKKDVPRLAEHLHEPILLYLIFFQIDQKNGHVCRRHAGDS